MTKSLVQLVVGLALAALRLGTAFVIEGRLLPEDLDSAVDTVGESMSATPIAIPGSGVVISPAPATARGSAVIGAVHTA